jgi:hypothetical protein
MPVDEGGGQGARDIFAMRPDGSNVRRLTDDAFEEATAQFFVKQVELAGLFRSSEIRIRLEAISNQLTCVAKPLG